MLNTYFHENLSSAVINISTRLHLVKDLNQSSTLSLCNMFPNFINNLTATPDSCNFYFRNSLQACHGVTAQTLLFNLFAEKIISWGLIGMVVSSERAPAPCLYLIQFSCATSCLALEQTNLNYFCSRPPQHIFCSP